jgi:hypothetical protein
MIALQGLISRDARFKFDDAASRTVELGCNKTWLLLESNGGLLFDGLQLGREVRLRGFRTITRYDCASACSMIFLGGTERVLAGSRARIGFHQPSTNRAGYSRRCGASIDSNGVREMRRYLRWVLPAESAEQVMAVIMKTSCDTIEWTYGQRAVDLGIATSIMSGGVDMLGPQRAAATTGTAAADMSMGSNRT